MNRNLPAFLITAALGTILAALCVASFAPRKADAYAIGTTSAATGTIGQGYDFASSFGDLMSTFTNFFNNIKDSGGTVSISGGGAAGGAPGVTVNIDTRSYVEQFDAWFYGLTGVHMDGILNGIGAVFGWIFGFLEGAVSWIAQLVTKRI